MSYMLEKLLSLLGINKKREPHNIPKKMTAKERGDKLAEEACANLNRRVLEEDNLS